MHFTVYDAADLTPVGSGGLFGIGHLMGRAGLGILLGERRGRGIGTDAVRLLLRWAFADLGLHNVMLEAHAWSEAALRAYERAGFRLVGRRRGSLMSEGRRYDEVIMDVIAPDVLT
ncbi:MAG: GNAT family N-acetyltransferase [Actinomycetota bacterium]|nr:GNAT family N-acetyltransferase [Actinomycetota bacterium]